MKHVAKRKDALKIKIIALLTCCTLIAMPASVVVLADGNATSPTDTVTTLSEESIKYKFYDPDQSIHLTEDIPACVAQEQDQPETEYPLGDQIAYYAYGFAGWLPYEWGGSSLEYGADCCGFTQAIYRAFGIEIPRTVEEQACIGYSVSFEEAQPGDIIIYYGHVGLYAGEGMMIHSPYPGTCVSYEEVYDGIQDIRRVI